MILKMSTDEQIKEYWDKAKVWSDQQDWAYYRTDEFAARKGIAEYLANQDGLTVFYSNVGREYDTTKTTM